MSGTSTRVKAISFPDGSEISSAKAMTGTVIFEAYLTTSRTVPDGIGDALTADAISYDLGFGTYSILTGEWTSNITARIRINTLVSVTAIGNGNVLQLYVNKNGMNVSLISAAVGGTGDSSSGGSRCVDVSPGDIVYVGILQTTGSGKTMYGADAYGGIPATFFDISIA